MLTFMRLREERSVSNNVRSLIFSFLLSSLLIGVSLCRREKLKLHLKLYEAVHGISLSIADAFVFLLFRASCFYYRFDHLLVGSPRAMPRARTYRFRISI